MCSRTQGQGSQHGLGKRAAQQLPHVPAAWRVRGQVLPGGPQGCASVAPSLTPPPTTASSSFALQVSGAHQAYVCLEVFTLAVPSAYVLPEISGVTFPSPLSLYPSVTISVRLSWTQGKVVTLHDPPTHTHTHSLPYLFYSNHHQLKHVIYLFILVIISASPPTVSSQGQGCVSTLFIALSSALESGHSINMY